MKFLQFEAAPEGNILHTLDNTIRACVEVPDDASDDYGYLAMKKAILAAYHGTEPLEFWYDGQEDHLDPDAWCGDPTVEVEETPETVTVNGTETTLEIAAMLMDDEIREAIHAEGVTDPQEFIDRYCEAHRKEYGEEFTV